MFVYQKTLLYSLKNIDRAIKGCEDSVESLATDSKFSRESCLLISNRILEIIEEKGKLVRLKKLLSTIVGNFTEKEKDLFLHKYMGEKKDFGTLSQRQYYRNQEKLLKNFSSTLKIFDLPEDVFVSEYLSIPYIKSLYNLVKFKDGVIQKRVKNRNIA